MSIHPCGVQANAALLSGVKKRWLVSGAAGFIGSHILEELLRAGQEVVVVDDFSTGHQHNLDDVRQAVGPEHWRGCRFVRAQVGDVSLMRELCTNIDVVVHQAALGSVPRSVELPLATHAANVTGFVTLLDAARECGVARFVFASSSSVYGDSESLPKVEHEIGKPLSPYAASKRIDEIYGDAFAKAYGMSIVALRYFNVFGPRQDPQGAYAAVIPRWIMSLLKGEPCVLYGDGLQSRDFCYIDNVVHANLLAALSPLASGAQHILNIACGERTNLMELYRLTVEVVSQLDPDTNLPALIQEPERAGDVKHSLADLREAERLLAYRTLVGAVEGMRRTVLWYKQYGMNIAQTA